MDITDKHQDFEKSDKYFRIMKENYMNKLNGKTEVLSEKSHYPKQGKIKNPGMKTPKAFSEEEVPPAPVEEPPPADAGAPPAEVPPVDPAATDVPPVDGAAAPLEPNPTLVAQVKSGMPDIVAALQAIGGEETTEPAPEETPAVEPEQPAAAEAGAPPAPLNEDVTDLQQPDASAIPPAADATAPAPTEIEPTGDDVDPKGFLVKTVQSTTGDGTVFHVIVVPGSLMPNIDEVFAAVKEKLNTGAGATDAVTSAELGADAAGAAPADAAAMPPVDAGSPPAEPEKLQEEEKEKEKEEAKEERLDEKRDPTYSGKKDWKKMLSKLLNESAKPAVAKLEEEKKEVSDADKMKNLEKRLADATDDDTKEATKEAIAALKSRMAKAKTQEVVKKDQESHKVTPAEAKKVAATPTGDKEEKKD